MTGQARLVGAAACLSHRDRIDWLREIHRTVPPGQLARRHRECSHNSIAGLCLVLQPIAAEAFSCPFADTSCKPTRTSYLLGAGLRRDERAYVDGAVGHRRQPGRRGVQGHGVKHIVTLVWAVGHERVRPSEKVQPPSKVRPTRALPPTDWMRGACTPDMVAVPPADWMRDAPPANCMRRVHARHCSRRRRSDVGKVTTERIWPRQLRANLAMGGMLSHVGRATEQVETEKASRRAAASRGSIWPVRCQ